jgi:large subunit ribosomal protein L24
MAKKLHIKKGDTVMVITGESKGYQGKVLQIIPAKNKAIVEGANLVSRHTKPNAQNTEGGIIKKEAPIHLSNLMLIDPKEGKPTRVGRRKENNKLIRYSKLSGEDIK